MFVPLLSTIALIVAVRKIYINSKTFSPWRENTSLDPLGLWRRHLLWGEKSNECYSAFICIQSFSACDRFAARYTAQIFQLEMGCFLNFAQILSWAKTVYKRAVNLIELYTASYNCLPLFIFHSCDCPPVMCDSVHKFFVNAATGQTSHSSLMSMLHETLPAVSI